MPTRRVAGTWLDSVDPTVNDDRSTDPLAPRVIGDWWINLSTPSIWESSDDTPGAAVWVQIYPGSGGSGGAPTTAQYVTLALDATLTAERRLQATAPVQIADGGAGADVTLSVDAATTAAVGVVRLATPSSDTTAGRAVQASDARLSDARTPTGSAGGDLTGTYPNPTISSSVITTAARTVLDDATVALMLATLGGVPTTRTLTGATPILIAGDNAAHDLSADRTISLDTTAIRGISSGNTGAIYTHYLPYPGHATFVDPSQEFMSAASAGGWTNAWDFGSIGVSKTVTEAGIQITIPTGGGGQKGAGYYHSTYPTGDYCVAFYLTGIHPLVAFSYTALALMQDGASSTGDAYLVGLFGQAGAADPNAHVGEITAYNAGVLTSRFTSTAGWPGVYGVIRVGGTHVTSWVGSEPTHLVLRDLDRTLGYTPKHIGLVGWSYTRTAVLTCPYVRIISDTYPGATYAVPPVISGARFFGL